MARIAAVSMAAVMMAGFPVMAADPAPSQNAPVVRRIVQPSRTPHITYQFHYDDKVISQTVTEGGVVNQPQIPENTSDGKSFVGWYEKDGDTYTKQFTDFEKPLSGINETSTVDLYARYQDGVYVLYYDDAGHLIESQKAGEDGSVTIEAEKPVVRTGSTTLAHVGWHLKGETANFIGTHKIQKSISLYPIVSEGYWVTFDTDGGTSIDRQFVARNATGDAKKAKQPDVTPFKKGYTFTGWYTSKDGDTPYDFNSDVNGNVTVYAHFKPADDTEYTIEYYIEYQKTLGTGVGVKEDNGIWDYKLLAKSGGIGTTGTEASFDQDLIFQAPYNEPREGYELNQEKTVAPTIAADGSTVYRVYYQCKEYDLEIRRSPIYFWYSNHRDTGPVKYGTDMTNFWKRVYNQVPKDELFDGKHRFEYWLSNRTSYRIIEDDDEFQTMPCQDVSLYWVEMPETNNYVNIYVESLHGTAPNGKNIVSNVSRRKQGDSRKYYLEETGSFSQDGGACVDVHAEEYPGFTFMPEYSDGHYVILDPSNVNVYYREQYSNSHAVYDADHKLHMYEGKDDPLNLYFKRNTYRLNFHTDGGTKIASKDVLFEDDLKQFDPASYVIGSTEKISGNQKFVFAGWYADPNLTQEFLFDGATMPAHDEDLYAKWTPKAFTVTFDSHGGSAISPAVVSDVAYGQSIDSPDDPTFAGHTFLGWTLNGKPYHFANGVTDDMTLVAAWRSNGTFAVKYDLNGGSGTVPSDAETYYEDAGVPVASADGILAPAGSGKVFLGWKSSKDGSIYYPGSRAPMGMPASGKDGDVGLTLTAQWGDPSHVTKLKYDFNYGQFGISVPGVQSITVNKLVNNSLVSLDNPANLGAATPSGWTFGGWYLDAACTKALGNEVLIDNRDEDTANIVYAKWMKVPKKSQTGSNTSSGKKGSTSKKNASGAAKTASHARVSSVKTGDAGHVTAWFITICSAAAAGMLLAMRRKKL